MAVKMTTPTDSECFVSVIMTFSHQHAALELRSPFNKLSKYSSKTFYT